MNRRDIYQEITDTVIAALEAGTVPWHKPWASTGQAGAFPTSIGSGKPYRGVNLFLLGLTAQAKGYTSPYWGTFNAIKERGGMVRKGEKGTLVTFWKRLVVDTTPDERAAGRGDKKAIPMLRHYCVFNAEQAEGLPEKYSAPVEVDLTGFDPIAEAEAIVAGYQSAPIIKEGGFDGAWYSPARDLVSMPARSDFDGPEEWYSTLFHELGHSTGHKDRLARPSLLESHRFGDESYSREELVAEMTAAMLSTVAGIDQRTVPNSAAYIAGWLKALKNDPKLVVQAGGQAQRAADHILGVSFNEEGETE